MARVDFILARLLAEIVWAREQLDDLALQSSTQHTPAQLFDQPRIGRPALTGSIAGASCMASCSPLRSFISDESMLT